MAEAARHGADDRLGEAKDAVGDAGMVHQLGRQHEERDCQQREGIDAGRHALGRDQRVHAHDQHHVAEADDHHDGSDRHAGRQQQEEDEKIGHY